MPVSARIRSNSFRYPMVHDFVWPDRKPSQPVEAVRPLGSGRRDPI